VHVALGTDAHGGGHSLLVLLAHLDGPLHLLDVLEILNIRITFSMARYKKVRTEISSFYGEI
jgi:hypothetical protein